MYVRMYIHVLVHRGGSRIDGRGVLRLFKMTLHARNLMCHTHFWLISARVRILVPLNFELFHLYYCS